MKKAGVPPAWYTPASAVERGVQAIRARAGRPRDRGPKRTDHDVQLCLALRARAAALAITLEAVAEEIGVHRNVLGTWLAGKVRFRTWHRTLLQQWMDAHPLKRSA